MRGKPCPNCLLAALSRITPARAGKTLIRLRRISTSWDHPRACGENIMGNKGMFPLNGSPPRVRGKLHDAAGRRGLPRITPARAGKTRRTLAERSTQEDHPRACGENVMSTSYRPMAKGSPPRVRGKPFLADRLSPRSGITPARAGKTLHHHSTISPFEDHPRACGENACSRSAEACRRGSPPRVRGKRFA